MTNDATQSAEFDAWNPGLSSAIPSALLPFVSLYRPENSSVTYSQAKEISEFCGLNPVEVISFKTERLIVHELLIRVSADLGIPDGPNYEDLGICLRNMVDRIFTAYVTPNLALVQAVHNQIAVDAESWVGRELTDLFAPAAPLPSREEKGSFFSRIFGKSGNPGSAPHPSHELSPITIIENYTERRRKETDPFEKACLNALIKVLGAIIVKWGRLIHDPSMISKLAVRMVCNTHGSEKIGEAIEPFVQAAIAAENFHVLPVQEKPVIMNVKGASAAGKSTIRPQQMLLANKLGVPWKDFAVISPDYWRKYLLDYDSMGNDAKYAAMLTGQELEIVDKKLDCYMAEKASKGKMTHLLIDRFRFDSFMLENEKAANTRLLTRFGDLVFMFFMITAPEATVERAWQRGITTGRYKAVDDLIFHNIEAYTGMPKLFFSWALTKDKRIHYEFLDNNVREGEQPRTVAFGWNDEMTILDIKCMIDIDRYRKLNVKAKRPDDIFNDGSMSPKDNCQFLEQCAKLIASIQFADYRTGYVYGKLERGNWVWQDFDYLENTIGLSDWTDGLRAIGWYDDICPTPETVPELDLRLEKSYTLGSWAPDMTGVTEENAISKEQPMAQKS